MDPKIIGAFGLLCLCSISSSIAASMGGEETPTPTPGAGAGAGAGTDAGTDADAGADAGGGAGADAGADDDSPAGDTFHSSTLPDFMDATILNAGSSLGRGEKWEPPNKSYNMVLQGDNNLCINEPGKARACLMSHQVGGTAKADFQGDGNLCVNGQPGVKCHMSHDSNVPSGQHRLILHNNGDVYVDHGTGEANRFMIYDHP